ncbi:MAG: Stp1/IreP family PP2C-type Ser/Thr phosphatase [Deltaproteobacteria bacterium]|nr:Stp1/IreP family PP2C-type Ser/Thr phosphatase [Deltaproteobacteria bacterium]
MHFITVGSASHIGQKKEENQDYFSYNIPEDGSVPEKGILLALADGMGGHAGGAVASRMAIDVVMKEYYADESKNIPESLKNAFLKANREVMARGDKDRSLQGMGTTLVAVVLKKNKMYYNNVGDSRGYIIDGNSISQFSEDHSVVANLVKAGYITEEEAPTYPGGNIITKAIGIDPELKIGSEKKDNRISDGMYILLCCDGLYREVSNEEIKKTVKEFKEPDIICNKLVEKANEHGGEDNITVLLARINKPGLLSNLKMKITDSLR